MVSSPRGKGRIEKQGSEIQFIHFFLIEFHCQAFERCRRTSRTGEGALKRHLRVPYSHVALRDLLNWRQPSGNWAKKIKKMECEARTSRRPDNATPVRQVSHSEIVWNWEQVAGQQIEAGAQHHYKTIPWGKKNWWPNWSRITSRWVGSQDINLPLKGRVYNYTNNNLHKFFS